MNVSQGPKPYHFGHVYTTRSDDGYAVCDNCGTREDSSAAAKSCPDRKEP